MTTTLLRPKMNPARANAKLRLENFQAVALDDSNSHDKDCNRDGATEVSNVRVESFHAALRVVGQLLFFLGRWLKGLML